MIHEQEKSNTQSSKKSGNNMGDKLDNNNISQNVINGVSEQSFNKLNDEQKNIVLTGNNDSNAKTKDSGFLGRLLGANTQNASIHIALIVCIILLLFCFIDLICSLWRGCQINSEVWNLVFPVVTLALGYIFGKGK